MPYACVVLYYLLVLINRQVAVVLSALATWVSGRPPGLRRSVSLARRWECESTQVAVVCTPSFDRSVLKSFLVVRDETGGWTRVS